MGFAVISASTKWKAMSVLMKWGRSPIADRRFVGVEGDLQEVNLGGRRMAGGMAARPVPKKKRTP